MDWLRRLCIGRVLRGKRGVLVRGWRDDGVGWGRGILVYYQRHLNKLRPIEVIHERAFQCFTSIILTQASALKPILYSCIAHISYRSFRALISRPLKRPRKPSLFFLTFYIISTSQQIPKTQTQLFSESYVQESFFIYHNLLK